MSHRIGFEREGEFRDTLREIRPELSMAQVIAIVDLIKNSFKDGLFNKRICERDFVFYGLSHSSIIVGAKYKSVAFDGAYYYVEWGDAVKYCDAYLLYGEGHIADDPNQELRMEECIKDSNIDKEHRSVMLDLLEKIERHDTSDDFLRRLKDSIQLSKNISHAFQLCDYLYQIAAREYEAGRTNLFAELHESIDTVEKLEICLERPESDDSKEWRDFCQARIQPDLLTLLPDEAEISHRIGFEREGEFRDALRNIYPDLSCEDMIKIIDLAGNSFADELFKERSCVREFTYEGRSNDALIKGQGYESITFDGIYYRVDGCDMPIKFIDAAVNDSYRLQSEWDIDKWMSDCVMDSDLSAEHRLAALDILERINICDTSDDFVSRLQNYTLWYHYNLRSASSSLIHSLFAGGEFYLAKREREAGRTTWGEAAPDQQESLQDILETREEEKNRRKVFH